MEYTIHFEKNPTQADIQIFYDGIAEYAKLKKNHQPIEFFAYFIKDDDEKIVGGCNGDILYGCSWIGSLWVSEKLRHQGYGTRLMTLAEKYAKERNCRFMAVNTMDWEALDFYKKLGFYIEFERHGFDKGSVFYFLRKDF